MKIRLISNKENNIQEFEAETVYFKIGVKVRWFGEGAGFSQIIVCLDEVLANYEMNVDGSDFWIGIKDGK